MFRLQLLLLIRPIVLLQQLAEVRQVGDYKKGTLLLGNNVAEIVVILKTLPTKEACEALARKIEADMKSLTKIEVITREDTVSVSCHDRGFDIATSQAKVTTFITTLAANIRKLEPGTHLDPKVVLVCCI